MTMPNALRPGWQAGVGLCLGALVCAAALTRTFGADTNAPAAKAAETKPVEPRPPATKKTPLSGAELYSMHCNRCHPERYPTERTAAQWNTLLLHMRVRANLPAEQARTILKYLQENSGR